MSDYKAANKVLRERQRLLEAEVIDLQLALLERAVPENNSCNTCDRLGAQVATLRSENTRLRSKLKRSKTAAAEAVAGLKDALATERSIRAALERQQQQNKVPTVERKDDKEDDESLGNDDHDLWAFPSDIVFPLATTLRPHQDNDDDKRQHAA